MPDKAVCFRACINESISGSRNRKENRALNHRWCSGRDKYLDEETHPHSTGVWCSYYWPQNMGGSDIIGRAKARLAVVVAERAIALNSILEFICD